MSNGQDREANTLKPTSSPTPVYGTFTLPVSDAATSGVASSVERMPALRLLADDDNSDTVSIKSNDNLIVDGADNEDDYHDDDADAEAGSSPKPSITSRRHRLIKHWSTIAFVTGLVAGFLLAAVLFYPARSHPPSSPPWPDPAPDLPSPNTTTPALRVLIIGDSITQGAEGDYSWRYRLWSWLHAHPSPTANHTFSFVGPYTGTFPPDDSPRPPTLPPAAPSGPDAPAAAIRTWGGYAWDVDAAFALGPDRAHFAHWGRQAAEDKALVGDVVRAYRPDYVLVALGFNDLAWWYGADDTLASVTELIGRAREAKAGLKFAVANVPQRTPAVGWEDLPRRTDEYNGKLEVEVGRLDSEESPVRLVRLREAYDAKVSSHDGLHPNSQGEFQIAKAFSDVMHGEYGWGSEALSVPEEIPLRPCWAPKGVKAVTTILKGGARVVEVSWDGLYGAFGYYVQARQKGWGWGAGMFTNIRTYKSYSIGRDQDWEMRVQSYCGDQQSNSPWSDIISVQT